MMQQANVMEQWGFGVVELIVSVLGITGIGKIIADVRKERADRKQRRVDVHVTNEAKAIDADQDAMKLVFGRLDNTEIEVKELRDLLRKESVTNARLSAENESLKRDNERLSIDLRRLEDEVKKRDDQIASFKQSLASKDKDIDVLKSEITGMREEMSLLRTAMAESILRSEKK